MSSNSWSRQIGFRTSCGEGERASNAGTGTRDPRRRLLPPPVSASVSSRPHLPHSDLLFHAPTLFSLPRFLLLVFLLSFHRPSRVFTPPSLTSSLTVGRATVEGLPVRRQGCRKVPAKRGHPGPQNLWSDTSDGPWSHSGPWGRTAGGAGAGARSWTRTTPPRRSWPRRKARRQGRRYGLGDTEEVPCRGRPLPGRLRRLPPRRPGALGSHSRPRRRRRLAAGTGPTRPALYPRRAVRGGGGGRATGRRRGRRRSSRASGRGAKEVLESGG